MQQNSREQTDGNIWANRANCVFPVGSQRENHVLITDASAGPALAWGLYTFVEITSKPPLPVPPLLVVAETLPAGQLHNVLRHLGNEAKKTEESTLRQALQRRQALSQTPCQINSQKFRKQISFVHTQECLESKSRHLETVMKSKSSTPQLRNFFMSCPRNEVG